MAARRGAVAAQYRQIWRENPFGLLSFHVNEEKWPEEEDYEVLGYDDNGVCWGEDEEWWEDEEAEEEEW